MAVKKVETKRLIAQRVPPGDRWTLEGDEDKIVINGLTHALEAYKKATGFVGHYRLEPMNGQLYALSVQEHEEKPQYFDLYGENP